MPPAFAGRTGPPISARQTARERAAGETCPRARLRRPDAARFRAADGSRHGWHAL